MSVPRSKGLSFNSGSATDTNQLHIENVLVIELTEGEREIVMVCFQSLNARGKLEPARMDATPCVDNLYARGPSGTNNHRHVVGISAAYSEEAHSWEYTPIPAAIRCACGAVIDMKGTKLRCSSKQLRHLNGMTSDSLYDWSSRSHKDHEEASRPPIISSSLLIFASIDRSAFLFRMFRFSVPNHAIRKRPTNQAGCAHVVNLRLVPRHVCVVKNFNKCVQRACRTY